MWLTLGTCRIDLERAEAQRDDEVHPLTDAEVRMLRMLADQPHKGVDHAELLDAVWPDGSGTLRRLQHVARSVRLKIEDDPAKPNRLLTLRSIGYRLEPTEVQRTRGAEILRLGDTRIDLRRGSVERGGARFVLTKTERSLLAYLSARSGAFVSVEQLLREVWGYRSGVRSRTLDTTVSRLRNKLEEDPSNPRYLLRQRGRGVRLASSTPALSRPERCFGRAELLGELRSLFDSTPGVLVHGPGGIGKSHLVRRLLSEVEEVCVGGCWWVPLGGAQTPVEAFQQIARVLGYTAGLSAHTDRNIEVLGNAIAERARCAVVLDAVESVHEVIAEAMVAWPQLAPRATFVLTSRQRINVRGLSVLAVGPMGPEATGALLHASLSDLGKPALDETVLERLVADSEGVPLTAELLAARAALFGDAGPGLLAVRQHRRESRLSSLRINIQLSWDLCTDAGRRALAMIAAFSRPVEASVLRDLVDDVDGVLAELTAASIVQVIATGARRRYFLFDAVREYAREQPEWEEARQLHGRWVHERGLQLEALSLSPRPASLDAQLDDYMPELRRALDRGHLDARALAALLLSLVDLLAQRHLETLRRLAEALATATSSLRAHPDLVAAAMAAKRLRIWPREEPWPSLHAWARSQTDHRLVRWSHHLELFERNWAGDRSGGLQTTEAGLARLEELGSFQERLTLLAHHVDQLAVLGDPRAPRILQQALQQDADRIPPMWRAHMLYRIANLHRKAACFRSARLEASQSVAAFRALGLTSLMFTPLHLRALCSLHLGDVDDARGDTEEALHRIRFGGFGASAAFTHRLDALVALHDGRWEQAIARLGAADEAAVAGGAPQVLPFNGALRGLAFHLQGAIAGARSTYAVAWDSGSGPQTRGLLAAWGHAAFADTEEHEVWTARLADAAREDWQAQAAWAALGGPLPTLHPPENTVSCYVRLTERLGDAAS